MFVLKDIGWAALIAVLFILFHFLFERGLHLKKVVALNIRFWNLEIIAGVYYSLTTLVATLIIWNFDRSFSIPVGIITSLVLITLRTPIPAIVNLFPSLVFYLLFFKEVPISPPTYAMYGVGFAGMIIYVIFEEFFPKKPISKINLSTAVIVSAVISFLVFISKNNYPSIYLFETTLILALMAIINLIIVSYFMSVSKSANILFDSVTYAYLNYYRQAVAFIAIQNLIQNKRIDKGLFIVFRHSFSNEISEDSQKEITKQFLQDFAKKVPKDAIIFAIEQNMHGIFMPTFFHGNITQSLEGNNLKERYADDVLKFSEKLFMKSQSEYFTYFGEKATVNIKAGAAIYGVQSSSLIQLEENAIFALNAFNSKTKNIVSLHDPKKLKEILHDSKMLSNLDYALKLDNFENTFRGIFDAKQNAWIGAHSRIVNASGFNWVNSVREHVKFNGWTLEFDRYFAINALKEFSDSNLGKIFFNYSPILLDKNLDFEMIKNKVVQLGVQPNEVIFILDEKVREKWQIENIKNAKALGFEIAFYNIIDKKTLAQIRPSWLIISPKYFNVGLSSYKSITIFDEINSLENLRVAKAAGARYYSGSLLTEETKLKDFEILSKQSKIYLKELMTKTLEGVKHE